MNELKWFVWLFPLLFIVHDMEEIIMAEYWCKKNLKQYVRLPITPFGNTKNTAGMAIGVFEELILWFMVRFARGKYRASNFISYYIITIVLPSLCSR